MDNKNLVEAALTGNVELLQKFLQENPFTSFELEYSHSESLLHVAIKARQLNFVRELMKHQPELSREPNKDGLRPMDIASFTGNVEILKELITINGRDLNICRLGGKDRKTALHYAAMKGRVEVINELISTCPDCIKDITIRGETALHLAVENNQFEAFSELVKWLERLSLEAVVNFRNCDGNTVLHLAAARKQHETIELMVRENKAISVILEVNATNSKGLTAMDVLDIVMDRPSDLKLQQILGRARGGLRAQDLSSTTIISPHASPPPPPFQQEVQTTHHDHDQEDDHYPGTLQDWIKYFSFQHGRDSPSDARNALLVVAALIATVTFQAGVTPPTGLGLGLDHINATNTTTGSSTNGTTTSSAQILSEWKVNLFLFTNTLGFGASASIIEYLTGKFPFQRELRLALFSMGVTYGVSIFSSGKLVSISYLLTFTIAAWLPFSIRQLPSLAKKAWRWCTN